MTIKTDIIEGDLAKQKIQEGARKVYKPVAGSLGPSGQNSAIAYRNENGIYGRIIMRDGVTIARSIELEDEFENFGAQVLKEAARKQVDEVGDGTSVTVILSYSILYEINKLVAAGHDPMLLRKGIEDGVTMLIKEIETQAIPVKTLSQKQQIANVSANDKELGNLIASTIHDVGTDGLVVVEESTRPKTTVEKQKGFQFDKGFATQDFVTDPRRMEATVEKPYIIVTDESIFDLSTIKDLLQEIANKKAKLVFIAANFSLVTTGLMIDNKNRGVIPSLLIEAPSFGQNQKNVLQDIAILTHAKFFSQSTGLSLKDATLDDLGRCEYVKSTRNETLIVGGLGAKEAVSERIAEIKKSIETEDVEYDREKIKERLARFTSGVSVIRVGGATETEMKERLERVKDSVAATKAAVKKGIVPGGEVIYLTIREKLDKTNLAQNILYKAFYEPFKILLTNASMNDGEWFEKLKHAKPTDGIDVVKQQIVDMVKEGIIDPAQVSQEALRNASSIAIANSSAGFIIIQQDIDKKVVK